MDSQDLSVVLGAGPLGLAITRALRARGKRVRLVSRRGTRADDVEVEVERADLSRSEEVQRACRQADVVYFCAKPPYAAWPTQFPPLVDALVAGLSGHPARLIYTDNLYAYGYVDSVLAEDLPHQPNGPKGETRAKLVEQLLAAHLQGRVRVAIARCSDFYGPWVTDSALGARVFAASLAGKPAELLGNIDAPHTYAFIDDVAAGLLVLAQHERALGDLWHLPAAETISTRAFVRQVYELAGRAMKVRVAPRLFVTLMGLVNQQMRELKEVLYTFEQPLVVSHAKFSRAFGALPTTPHRQGIEQTLRWFGERAQASQKSRCSADPTQAELH